MEGEDLVGSDGGATGEGSQPEQEHIETLSDDDMSDTGWDTDLEIEGEEVLISNDS